MLIDKPLPGSWVKPLTGSWVKNYYNEYLVSARAKYGTEMRLYKPEKNDELNKRQLKNHKLNLIIEELTIAGYCQNIVLNSNESINETLSHTIFLLGKAKIEHDDDLLQKQASHIINWYNNKGKEALKTLCSYVYLDKNRKTPPIMPKKVLQNIFYRNLGEVVSYAAILASTVILTAGIIAIAAGALAPWGIMLAGSSLIIAAALLATASLILTSIIGIKIYLNENKLDEKKALYDLNYKEYQTFLAAREECKTIITDLGEIILNQKQEQNNDPSKTNMSSSSNFFQPSSTDNNRPTSSAVSSNDPDTVADTYNL